MLFTVEIKRGRWYFQKKELHSGADLFLDIIADGDDVMKIDVKYIPFQGATELVYRGLDTDDVRGAYYYIENCLDHRVDLVVWLPDELLFLNEPGIPPCIYIKKVKTPQD